MLAAPLARPKTPFPWAHLANPVNLTFAPRVRRDNLLYERSQPVAADFALPDDKDAPPGFLQLALMHPVPFLGALALRSPIVRVAVWDATVPTPRVLMPEAAVDEHCRRVAPEHNVGSPRKVSQVLSEPKSAALKIRPHPALWCRLSAPDPAHHPAARLGRNRIGHDFTSLLNALSPCYSHGSGFAARSWARSPTPSSIRTSRSSPTTGWPSWRSVATGRTRRWSSAS